MWLNVVLLGGLICLVTLRRTTEARTVPAVTSIVTSPPTTATRPLPEPFRWSQLGSTNYEVYVANLRASGCPETTVQDIVRGDTARAFAFERARLGLDGSGSGPWSRSREAQLIARLLGEQSLVAGENTVAVQSGENQPETNDGTGIAADNAKTHGAQQPSSGQPQTLTSASAVSYPLVFRNVNLDALGLSASQKSAIQQLQQQFVNDIGGPNQNPNDPAYLARWQKAQGPVDAALLNLLGTQGYMAYQQQMYYEWYQPQVQSAGVAGRPLTINPALFSK